MGGVLASDNGSYPDQLTAESVDLVIVEISTCSLKRVLYVSILCDSNIKLWFSLERLWLLNV